MDSVFQEEKEQLNKIEKRIDDIIQKYETRASELYKEIDGYYVVDNDDRENLQYIRREYHQAKEYANEYRSFKSVPYFGRLDLELDTDVDSDKDTSQIYYIGKTGIRDGLDIIVLDWRSPIGEFFYVKTEKKFKHDKSVYNLLLRRALAIDKGQLQNYNTEYDVGNVTLEGDVIDPFLLTVLKDKRRQNRLTDIIRTIQGNQNEIIRKPKNESFIVQGCAGSGKTMILLHRLSYLAFNNRNISFDQVKILTPNKFFDMHINDLSKELGLDSIERLTVEEFYVSLISSYTKKLEVSSDVITEKNMGEDFLTSVYSSNFQDQIISHYNAFWDIVIDELSSNTAFHVLHKMGVSGEKPKDYSYDSLSTLSANINKSIGDYERNQKHISEYANKTASLRDQKNNLTDEYDDCLSTLDAQIVIIKDIISQELEIQTKELEKLQVELKNATDMLEEKENEIRGVKVALDKYEALKDQCKKYTPPILTYDAIQALPPDILNYLDQLLATRKANVKKASRDYQNVPLFNFSKRNKLKKILEYETYAYVREAADALKKYTQEIQEQIDSLNTKLNYAQSELESLTANTQSQNINQLQKLVGCMQKVVSCFDTKNYPDFEVDLTSSEYEIMHPILSKYQDCFKSRNTFTKRLLIIEKSLADATSELAKFQSECVISDAEIKVLYDAQQLLQQLSFTSIYKNVALKDLRALYKEYSEPYTKNNYRHKIYVKLLFCSLYFKKAINSINFINVDEAQDLSVSEYKLLRKILGDRCVFNLYGDVNQLVYSYKGITDWEEIANTISPNVYLLNENYRNTLQITKYCNSEFGAQVYPIGINGKDVQDMSLDMAIEAILAYHTEHPESRIAITHRSGIASIREALISMLEQEDISWDEVNENKISVLSVELAKGLEFEAVISIVDHMTPNEKYISFTRALDELIVVRDKFEPNPIIDLRPDDFSEDADLILDDALPLSTDTINDAFETSQIDIKTPSNTEQTQEPKSTTNIVTAEEREVLSRVEDIIKDTINNKCDFDEIQTELIISLFNGRSVLCNAPSGWMKSIIFYAMVAFSREHKLSQSIIISQPHLQENVLVIAEKMHLKVGVIDTSIDDFMCDVKRHKYDLIFVPDNYFENSKNANDFVRYFANRVKYIATDHLDLSSTVMSTIISCGKLTNATMLLMSKSQSEVNDDSFDVINVFQEQKYDYLNKIHLISGEQKLEWLLDNLSVLSGQGLIYCDSAETCRKISKALRKKKINAPEYNNEVRPEQINFLTNAFTRESLPVLISTQEIGTNLSNANVRFIIHYDIPNDKDLYNLHLSQIGALAENPQAYDLIVM